MYLNIRILLFLNDNFRSKRFILENFLFEAPSHTLAVPPHTHKADSCRSNHLILYIEDIQDNCIR